MKASWPMRIALTATAIVWILGCVWSFTEQTQFAKSRGFEIPELLPLIVDGFAASVAMVAFAASLDGRPAVGARLGTLLAVGGSAASNASWAYTRSDGEHATVALAIGAPLVSAIAFEVILGELRRQVERKRGTKPPVKVPYPRLIRLVLNPLTFFPWRRLVLELTDPARDFVDIVNVDRMEGPDNVKALVVPAPEKTVLRSISIRAADEFPTRSRRSLERPGLHREFGRDFTETSTESRPGVRPVPATPDTTAARPLALIDPATMAPFAWPIDDTTPATGSTPAPVPVDREWTESPPGVLPPDRESDRESTGSATEKARLYWENEREQGRTPTGADLDLVAGTRDYGRKLRSKWLAEETPTGTENGSDPGHSRSTGSPTGSTPARPGVDRESTESRPGVLPVPLSTNGHHHKEA